MGAQALGSYISNRKKKKAAEAQLAADQQAQAQQKQAAAPEAPAGVPAAPANAAEQQSNTVAQVQAQMRRRRSLPTSGSTGRTRYNGGISGGIGGRQVQTLIGS